jgi:hypothetical protein
VGVLKSKGETRSVSVLVRPGGSAEPVVRRGGETRSVSVLVRRGETGFLADSPGPQRESTENSNETVVCLFGIIKSSPSGIHSGAGSVIHNWFGFVLVRHLTCGSYFFSTGS